MKAPLKTINDLEAFIRQVAQEAYERGRNTALYRSNQ